MRSIRRVGAWAAAGVLLTAVATGPAGADTPASYTGTASGYALRLSGLGQTFTAGGSEAKAASDGTATATGTGDSLVSGTVVTANNPPGETKPEECGVAVPPAPLDAVLALGLACGSASATGADLTTTATATGDIAGLDVNVQNLITQLPIPVDTVTGAVSGVLTEACAGVTGTPLEPLCALTSTTDEVLVSLTSTQTLAAEIGSSTSGVTVNGSSVTSKSESQATTIEILPLPVLSGVQLDEPLVTVSIAQARAQVVCDVGSGDAVPSFDPAIVRVKLSAPINALLSDVANPLPIVTIPDNPLINGQLEPVLDFENGEFSVTPGTTVVLFPGLPIQTTIAVGAGTSKVNPDGSASAAADGVKVAALELAPAPLEGGLLLNLAHAEATGACVAATITPAAAPEPPPAIETPRELPRTGGDSTPWLSAAGVAALAVAVVSRRALVRSK